MELRLVGIQGAKVGQTFALTGVDITVGREPDNILSFPGDSQVSRHHARISGGTVHDLGSTNGTRVNGQRIGGPTPLGIGDVVQFGSHQFQVESASAPPPPVEVPSAGGWGKKKERGSFESLYPKGPAVSGGGDGCAMPSFDFSGCAKALLILLIVMIIVLLIKGLLMLLGLGIGALSNTGTNANQPQHSAPAPQSQGQDQPPPQQQNQKGIEILEIKVDYDRHDGSTIKPIVLVKWRNGTENPVSRLTGLVRVYGRDGKRLIELPGQTIYHDTPVPPGETHQDAIGRGGVPITAPLSGIPGSATVEIERVE